MAEPTPNRPPTTAEAFFRTGFGCLGDSFSESRRSS